MLKSSFQAKTVILEFMGRSVLLILPSGIQICIEMIVRVVAKQVLSQMELSKLWDVPQPRVSEVLIGKISLISLERLEEFLAALDVHIDFKVRQTRRKSG